MKPTSKYFYISASVVSCIVSGKHSDEEDLPVTQTKATDVEIIKLCDVNRMVSSSNEMFPTSRRTWSRGEPICGPFY